MSFERIVLTRDAYRLTTRVGLVGVGLGIVLYVVVFALAVLAGMPLRGEFTLVAWFVIAGMALVMLLCLYVGCVASAAFVAWRLMRRGVMTRREALHYALLSRYPSAWCRT